MLASVLCLSTVALLSTKTWFNIPVGVMAILGLVQLLREPSLLRGDTALRRTTILFGCLWLPMLVSLSDAANLTHSLKTTSLYLHFLPAAWYLTIELRDARARSLVFFGIFALMVFWCADALIQYSIGRDLFGYPYDGQILKGIFHPKQRLGIVLAVFSPVYFEALRLLSRRSRLVWLLMLPLVVVLLLTLKRTAWVMFALAAIAYLWTLMSTQPQRRLRGFAPYVIAMLLAAAVTVAYNPNLQQHLQRSIGVFSTDFATADNATSYRLSLWRTAGRMFAAHWVNGVGPRGYRHVYVDHADADDFWIRRGTNGQTHPHLIALEVAVETGVIGLAGYLLFWMFAFNWLRGAQWAQAQTPAWIIASGVAWFPFSGHFAFYGSYWSSVAWLLLPIAIAAAHRPSTEAAG